MTLAIFGLWHLGSVTAACTAAAGVPTLGIDLDRARVALLAAGEPPLYEPGLAELIRAGIASGVLTFSADVAALSDADVVWVCHDTPVDDEDLADPDAVLRQVEMMFTHLKDGSVVLVSAQLPVGSVAQMEKDFAGQAKGRTVSFASSPENLRLGKAIEVFQNPSRIIVGVRDDRARTVLEPLLRTFCETIIWMSVKSAEMVKHGLNSFLAMSVTFANELATVCERVSADAAEVEKGLKSDPRIGSGAYLRPGPAFAGGTLARDVNFLRSLAREHHVPLPLIDGIDASNRAHGQWAYQQLERALKPLSERTIGVLGLAYKPGTSALRRSPSLDLIRALLKAGARVQAFDPHVSSLPEELKSVRLCADARSTAIGADALVVGNKFPEFRTLSAEDVAGGMKGCVVLDAGRFLAPGLAADKRLSLIYEVRRLVVAVAQPLVPAVRGDQAAPGRRRAPERGLLGERLGARVDQLVAHRLVLGPGRHEPPPHRAQRPLDRRRVRCARVVAGVPVDDAGDRQGRRDVVLGCLERVVRGVARVELLGQVGRVLGEGVTTAHTTDPATAHRQRTGHARMAG